MSFEALVAPLVRVPLFQGLSSARLVAIARAADRVVFNEGQTIIAQDRDDDAAYLIVKGNVEATNHFSRRSEILGPGVLVGEMAMLIDTNHTTTVVAVDTVNAMRLTRSGLHRLMEADPEIAAHFVGKLSARLRKMAFELKGVEAHLANSSVAPPDRVQHYQQ